MAITEDSVITVWRTIEADKKMTCQQIRATLGIAMNQVQKILHEHLGARKVCTRWIPHNLTEDQKRRRVD